MSQYESGLRQRQSFKAIFSAIKISSVACRRAKNMFTASIVQYYYLTKCTV